MNAYNLSTELLMASSEMEYNHVVNDWKLLSDSANMLRQQADRIAELEKQYATLQTQFDNLYEYANSGDEKQSEPVAWATEDLEDIMTPELRQAHIDHPESCTHKFFPIPLYTTQQTKPLKLSYEQINQVASRFSLNGFSYIDFAEAILEEASK